MNMNNTPVAVRIAQLHRNHVSRDITRQKIIDSFAKSNNQISADVYKVSLICPISKTRIVTPVRSPECKHLQCFDAESYHALYKGFTLYANNWVWKCPICLLKAPFSFLVIDSFFEEILRSKNLPENSRDVVFKPDGSWTPDVIKTPEILCIDISDDEDEENEKVLENPSEPTPSKTFKPRSTVVGPSDKTTSSPTRRSNSKERTPVRNSQTPRWRSPPRNRTPRQRSPSRNQRSPRQRSRPAQRRSPPRTSTRNPQYRNPYRIDYRRANTCLTDLRIDDQPLNHRVYQRTEQQSFASTGTSRTPTRGDLRNQIRSSMLGGAAEYNTNPWVPYGNGGQGGGPVRREPQTSRSHHVNPYQRELFNHQRYVLVPRSPNAVFLKGFPPSVYPFEIHRFLSGFGYLDRFLYFSEINTAYFIMRSQQPNWLVNRLHGLLWSGNVLEAGRSYSPNYDRTPVYY